jgi:hypothetical protein
MNYILFNYFKLNWLEDRSRKPEVGSQFFSVFEL